MKSFLTIALAALAAASPIANTETDVEVIARGEAEIAKRDLNENDYRLYGCRPVIFFWARGSTEPGNMGLIVGPGVCDGLKRRYGSTKVACQGNSYNALLSTNFLPGGADPAGIRELERDLDEAARECSSSKIVVGGYSQGAALVHRAVEDRSSSVKDKIVGAVTFGDTQNLQDGGRIPNFPREKTKIICALGDLVCYGTLTITAAHLSYGDDTDEAVDFLRGRIGSI